MRFFLCPSVPYVAVTYCYSGIASHEYRFLFNYYPVVIQQSDLRHSPKIRTAQGCSATLISDYQWVCLLLIQGRKASVNISMKYGFSNLNSLAGERFSSCQTSPDWHQRVIKHRNSGRSNWNFRRMRPEIMGIGR